MHVMMLKNTDSILFGSLADKFNNVRNNLSMADANTLLNSQESIFIFKVTASMIEFIESIED